MHIYIDVLKELNTCLNDMLRRNLTNQTKLCGIFYIVFSMKYQNSDPCNFPNDCLFWIYVPLFVRSCEIGVQMTACLQCCLTVMQLRGHETWHPIPSRFRPKPRNNPRFFITATKRTLVKV